MLFKSTVSAILASAVLLQVATGEIPGLSYPSYLENASSQAQDEFREILTSNSTIAEQKQQIADWAKRNDLTQEETDYEKSANETLVKLNEGIAKLPEPTQTKAKEFVSMITNQDQTPQQLGKKVLEYGTANPEVIEQLEKILQSDSTTGEADSTNTETQPTDAN